MCVLSQARVLEIQFSRPKEEQKDNPLQTVFLLFSENAKLLCSCFFENKQLYSPSSKAFVPTSNFELSYTSPGLIFSVLSRISTALRLTNLWWLWCANYYLLCANGFTPKNSFCSIKTFFDQRLPKMLTVNTGTFFPNSAVAKGGMSSHPSKRIPLQKRDNPVFNQMSQKKCDFTILCEAIWQRKAVFEPCHRTRLLVVVDMRNEQLITVC